jgi:hypothetical protein
MSLLGDRGDQLGHLVTERLLGRTMDSMEARRRTTPLRVTSGSSPLSFPDANPMTEPELMAGGEPWTVDTILSRADLELR